MDQGSKDMLEHHTIRDPLAMAAKRMGGDDAGALW
jgi:hypothetical protein